MDSSRTLGEARPDLATPPAAGDFRLLPGKRENEVAYEFDWWLGRMLELGDEILDVDERTALHYYDFPGKPRPSMPRDAWLRTLRGIMRGEEWMLQYILRAKPKRFVEIGAGLGTWCYLAGLAGVPEVYGVDIFSRFLAPALKMKDHFNRHAAGRSKVDFLLEDIHDIRWKDPIDIFYMKATIHHVLPLDPLFDYLRENLAPGGIVVVHDPNGANPVAQAEVFKRRGFKLRATYTDDRTGRTFEMANEDLLTVPGLVYRFWRREFRIVHQQFHFGFRTMADDWWYYNVVRRASGSMLVGAFAAPNYTIVAQKPL